MTKDEAQLIYRVMDKLSEGIRHVAPGSYGDFYAEYNEAWGILKREGAVRPEVSATHRDTPRVTPPKPDESRRADPEDFGL